MQLSSDQTHSLYEANHSQTVTKFYIVTKDVELYEVFEIN